MNIEVNELASELLLEAIEGILQAGVLAGTFEYREAVSDSLLEDARDMERQEVELNERGRPESAKIAQALKVASIIAENTFMQKQAVSA